MTKITSIATAVFLLFFVDLYAAVHSSGFVQLKGKLLNGTTGQAGEAEKVVLFRLVRGMDELATKGPVKGEFEFQVDSSDKGFPLLIQAISKGVVYNQKVNLGDKASEEVTIPVYDLVSSPDGFVYRIPHLFFGREGENVLVRQLIEVNNNSQPPKTWYQRGGTFRFFAPKDSTQEIKAAATYTSNLPISLQPIKTTKKNIFSVDYAFKPGTTNISVIYTLKYANEQLVYSAPVLYTLDEMNLFVAPADAKVTASDLSAQPFDSSMGFLYFKGNNLKAGSVLKIEMSGGSKTSPQKPQAHPQQTMTTLNTMVSLYTVPLILTFAIILLFGTVLLFYKARSNQELILAGRKQLKILTEQRDRLIDAIATLDSRLPERNEVDGSSNSRRDELKSQLKAILQQLNSKNHPEE